MSSVTVGPPVSDLRAAEALMRLAVVDAASERDRLTELGVAVGPVEHVEGAVDYFDLADPEGNQFSIYSMVTAGS